MATASITIQVSEEAARAFAQASPEDHRKIQLLLDLRLRDLTVSPHKPLQTVMDEIGTPLKTRQHRLGHARIETTMVHYTHRVDADDRGAAEAIGSMLSPTAETIM